MLCCLLKTATAGTCSLAVLELSGCTLQHRASHGTDGTDLCRTAPRTLACLS